MILLVREDLQVIPRQRTELEILVDGEVIVIASLCTALYNLNPFQRPSPDCEEGKRIAQLLTSAFDMLSWDCAGEPLIEDMIIPGEQRSGSTRMQNGGGRV